MKILIYGINFSPELTGTGKYTGEMAQWLAKHGYEIRVVTAPPYYPAWKVTKPYSAVRFQRETLRGETGLPIRVWRCPLWVPSRPTGLKRVIHLASFAFASFPVILGQVFWKPDVVLVVAPTILCAPGAWIVAKCSRARTWLHLQDLEVDIAFKLAIVRGQWLLRAIIQCERWLFRRFDRVSTISTAMISALKEKSVPDHRIVLFPNWVDTQCIQPGPVTTTFRETLGFKDDSIVVLYSGNMGEKQGLELVVDAARKLEECPPDCETNDGREIRVDPRIEFLMCGDGVARSRLMERAKGLANVHWLRLQPVELLNELLDTADIHVLPQPVDAADLVMPSKLTAMLANGRPVIATAEANTEVARVVEGRGIVVRPGDVDRLIEAIVALARDPGRRKELGRSARDYAVLNLETETVLSRFDMDLRRMVFAGEVRSTEQ